jgi:hypothetical protein
MNRAFFIILLILLIVVPTTISINDTSQVSPIQVLVEKTKNYFIKSLVDEPREIVISNEQKLLINQKLNSLQNDNELFFVKYEQANIQNQKKINTFLAFYNWEQFSRENSGVKGIYLNGYHFTNEEKMKKFDEILTNTSVNTVVLDVKTDNGHLLYDSKIIEVDELKNERIKYDKNTLKEFKEKYNIYLIGRVVAFQDPIFSKKYIDASIVDLSTNLQYSQNGQYFLDPSDMKSRNYILNIALEACELGFDEIQFDYIRYPDTSYKNLKYDQESSFENRVNNINSFLSNATIELHNIGCLSSADIFGYVLNSKTDNGIGQYLESIIDTVDFISPMIYPSHYSSGSFGFDKPNNYPYEVITASLNDGLNRGVESRNLRPFLQGFWHSSNGVRLNIKAAEDKGLHWILWNNSSEYKLDYFTTIQS